MATKTIRIPGIIDANGKWSVFGSTYLEGPDRDPDWPWMNESADFNDPLVNPQRFWVTVEVPLPETVEVVGQLASAGEEG